MERFPAIDIIDGKLRMNVRRFQRGPHLSIQETIESRLPSSCSTNRPQPWHDPEEARGARLPPRKLTSKYDMVITNSSQSRLLHGGCVVGPRDLPTSRLRENVP